MWFWTVAPTARTTRSVHLIYTLGKIYNPSITAAVCAFSLTSLAAQRDAEIEDGRSGAAVSSRILPRPGGRGRGGRLRHGVPGHGRLPGSGRLDDPGLVPISGPESRSRTPAASGSSWP